MANSTLRDQDQRVSAPSHPHGTNAPSTDTALASTHFLETAREVLETAFAIPEEKMPEKESPLPSVMERLRDRRERGHYCFRPRLHLKADSQVETLDILLTSIATAGLQNCRETDDQDNFKALVDSMAMQGLINPVSVIRDARNDGHYILVAGFRRLRAAAELGWRRIRATVVEVKGEADAYMLNLSENVARADLSPYELARQCQFLVGRFALTEAELAERLGYSYTHIHNLIRYLSLPSSIVESWKQRHPLLTLPRLQRLAASPNALELWEKARSLHSIDEGKPIPTFQDLLREQLDAEDDGSDGHVAFRRPSRAKLVKARDVLSRQRLPTDPRKVRDLVLDVIDYCRGAIPSIRGVVFPGLRPMSVPVCRKK